MPVSTIIAPADLRAQVKAWRAQGEKIAFVPTMGALHKGHISLVEAAQKKAQRVVVSIFVNPLQFGPKEDFASYPRMLKEDLEALDAAKVDALFAPLATDMYPEGFQTAVTNNEAATILDGKARPGHFNGVLTVVNKLFNLVQPDYAFFGLKDYQQLRVVSLMVKDLCMNLEVIGCPTQREPDGLAMSSRNLRLTPDERAVAPQLYKAMTAMAEAYRKGETSVEKLSRIFKDELAEAPAIRLEYIEIRTQDKLAEFAGAVDKPAVALVAAHLGSVRLIDNLEFG